MFLQVKTLARMVLHLQLFDWIIGSHKGVFGSPRGRATAHGKLLESGVKSQSIHTMLWIITGGGSLEQTETNRRGASMFLLALEEDPDLIHPVLPAVAEEVATGTHEMRERFAISSDPEEATSESLGFSDIDDCIFWFGNGAYFSPSTCRCLFLVGDWAYLWDRHPVWQQIAQYGGKALWDIDPFLVDAVAAAAEPLGGGPVLGRSNVYSWRTEAYMLSSVQAYHGGWMGGQQHTWQLTLDPGNSRTVFTGQPTVGSTEEGDNWGPGILPRLGQHKNTLIALYSPALLDSLVFNTTITHAHFYRDGFDEVRELLIE